MKLTIPFYSQSGEKLEPITLEVSDKFSKLNDHLVSQAVHVEKNNITAKPGVTKTKGEVRGGGRKPWKQKGTGRARAGSTRSPLWRGGGVTFGPTGEKKVLDIPKKMRQFALLGTLFGKIKDNELAIIEDISITSGKTKDANSILNKISDAKLIILAVDEASSEKITPWRNLAAVNIKRQDDINLQDVSTKRKIVYTRKAFEYIEKKAAK